MTKPLVYNYETAEEKIKAQADEIIRLKEENTNLRIRCKLAEAKGPEWENGRPCWIPVSMRLPETEPHTYCWFSGETILSESDPVLVYHEDRTYSSRISIATMVNEPGEPLVWNEVETGDVIDDVLAWMRLPEKYEEGSE